MSENCRRLWATVLKHVDPKDVPGFLSGMHELDVEVVTEIAAAGETPEYVGITICDALWWVWWDDPTEKSDPVRFRRFRMFINTIAVMAFAEGEAPRISIPPNYLAISLLDDAYALHDVAVLEILPSVFLELRQRMAEDTEFEGEAPFFRLAQLMLAFLGFDPSADVHALCEQLKAEEALPEMRNSDEFLWGCTFYDSFHERWKEFVKLSFPAPTDDNCISLVRDALLSSHGKAE